MDIINWISHASNAKSRHTDIGNRHTRMWEEKERIADDCVGGKRVKRWSDVKIGRSKNYNSNEN